MKVTQGCPAQLLAQTPKVRYVGHALSGHLGHVGLCKSVGLGSGFAVFGPVRLLESGSRWHGLGSGPPTVVRSLLRFAIY